MNVIGFIRVLATTRVPRSLGDNARNHQNWGLISLVLIFYALALSKSAESADESRAAIAPYALTYEILIQYTAIRLGRAPKSLSDESQSGDLAMTHAKISIARFKREFVLG
ncbi:hypothetical protein EVAR_8928_1 [Eumeta japonica]|uniref:Uncharacterized protein n=1 Tax=Eumeta variegata TaxID=151549 RepID=A0A4C1U0N0_EUMVA|nr:hypothetical protein EVAR_8928_1 [Eumeta japonica]